MKKFCKLIAKIAQDALYYSSEGQETGHISASFPAQNSIYSQKREILHMGLIPWNANISSVSFANSTHLGFRKLSDLFGIHKTSLKKKKIYLS